MASGLDSQQLRRLVRTGLRPISLQGARALFEQVVNTDEVCPLLVPIDRAAMRRAFGETVPPLWRALLPQHETPASEPSQTWFEQLAGMPEDQRYEFICARVQAEAASALSLTDAALVTPDRPLREVGMDSLLAVELRNALSRRVGRPLPATLVLDHPTCASISRFLLEHPPHRSTAATGGPIVALRTVQTRAAARLFCFPNAGGLPESFAKWRDQLRADLELYAITYPRNADIDGNQFVRAVAREVARRDDLPCAFFGHSLGARIAWGVASYLWARGQNLPGLMFASSYWSPHASESGAPLDRSPERIISWISGDQVPAADVSPALASAFAYDRVLAEAIVSPAASDAPRLPVVAFVGESDPVVHPNDLAQWTTVAGDFELETFPGDHFYLFDPRAQPLLLRSIERHVLRVLRAQDRAQGGHRL
jgi:surfactin synthase thioesterase subunit